MSELYRLIATLSCYLLIIMPCSSCDTAEKDNEYPFKGLYVVAVEPAARPVFTNDSQNTILTYRINCDKPGIEAILSGVRLSFTSGSSVSDISGLKMICGPSAGTQTVVSDTVNLYLKGTTFFLSGNYNFSAGENKISLVITLKQNALLTGTLQIENAGLILGNGKPLPSPMVTFPLLRYGLKLRKAGQDNCNTYRIPGIITTRRGTLVAVYDNRYNSGKDLQEDIDIGMSRSTDGGETWEKMKVIMDMDQYGGRPENQNGMGDPCILYDDVNDVIWVASLWMSGSQPDQMLWRASQPGMDPEVTGQFMLVKSSDDGLTWSAPVNITRQVKDPAWQLMLQGPGRGITMHDGTLVFPAQYKADIGTKAIDGGQYTPFSTVICSTDGGKTWKTGSGAKSNTTEAQVAELSDGTLMINMRDDRNRQEKGAANGRAVAVSSDLGKTWKTHPSSNSLLPEPNCMASLISSDMTISGVKKHILFFSNPANKLKRADMTIKASLDDGNTWPENYQVLLNRDEGNGYSCLTLINDNYLGILYEGARELYFQKIAIADILKIKGQPAR